MTWQWRHLSFLCSIRLLFLNPTSPTDSSTPLLQSFGEVGLQGEAWKKAACLQPLDSCSLRKRFRGKEFGKTDATDWYRGCQMTWQHQHQIVLVLVGDECVPGCKILPVYVYCPHLPQHSSSHRTSSWIISLRNGNQK